jgi:hypothetical protein
MEFVELPIPNYGIALVVSDQGKAAYARQNRETVYTCSIWTFFLQDINLLKVPCRVVHTWKLK